jgi:hypothetical protein
MKASGDELELMSSAAQKANRIFRGLNIFCFRAMHSRVCLGVWLLSTLMAML